MCHLPDLPPLHDLSAALSDSSSATVCDGAIRLLRRPLPGRAVCAARRIDGVLYVVVDLEKRHALREMLDMLRQRWADVVESVATESR